MLHPARDTALVAASIIIIVIIIAPVIIAAVPIRIIIRLGPFGGTGILSLIHSGREVHSTPVADNRKSDPAAHAGSTDIPEKALHAAYDIAIVSHNGIARLEPGSFSRAARSNIPDSRT